MKCCQDWLLYFSNTNHVPGFPHGRQGLFANGDRGANGSTVAVAVSRGWEMVIDNRRNRIISPPLTLPPPEWMDPSSLPLLSAMILCDNISLTLVNICGLNHLLAQTIYGQLKTTIQYSCTTCIAEFPVDKSYISTPFCSFSQIISHLKSRATFQI